jgi:hypothetical protein
VAMKGGEESSLFPLEDGCHDPCPCCLRDGDDEKRPSWPTGTGWARSCATTRVVGNSGARGRVLFAGTKHNQMACSQPAHATKHLPRLICPFAAASFTLSQRADGVSNGTALWLAAQCLAMYLAHHLPRSRKATQTRPRALELGSGIGFTAWVFLSSCPSHLTVMSRLALASLGWDVLATDIPHVIHSVLNSNVTDNLTTLPPNSGTVQVRELDWFVSPANWTWDHKSIISHSSPLIPVYTSCPLLCPPFDLIISADTVYASELVEPFLRTLYTLSTLSTSVSSRPLIFLCVERRDSLVLDRLLADANEKWKFLVERIPHKKLARSLRKGGVHWENSDWDGVELWKLRLAS